MRDATSRFSAFDEFYSSSPVQEPCTMHIYAHPYLECYIAISFKNLMHMEPRGIAVDHIGQASIVYLGGR
jgi:hypothetical protein